MSVWEAYVMDDLWNGEPFDSPMRTKMSAGINSQMYIKSLFLCYVEIHV